MKTSNVYILKLKDNPKLIKIGKADDITKRFEKLSRVWGKIDYKNSFKIICKKENVFEVEKILHLFFSEKNIKLNENKDGYTEWFEFESLSELFNVIEMLKQTGKITEYIEGISEKEIEKKSKKSVPKNKKIDYTKENFERIEKLEKMITEKTDKITKLLIPNKENDYQGFIRFSNIEPEEREYFEKIFSLGLIHTNTLYVKFFGSLTYNGRLNTVTFSLYSPICYNGNIFERNKDLERFYGKFENFLKETHEKIR